MKRIIFALVVIALVAVGCKKTDKTPEPAYVITKWARAIQDMNYQNYSRCEAYPKSEAVFRDMYRDYYLTDLMVTSVEDANEKGCPQRPGRQSLHTSIAHFRSERRKEGDGSSVSGRSRRCRFHQIYRR
ncbi:MAG: hypothetical protein EHM32_10125 [Spirochaetales bacterium]|nr:MAG: hypothetical protein EHM32_10125 [Spirochaetales bacterium]